VRSPLPSRRPAPGTIALCAALSLTAAVPCARAQGTGLYLGGQVGYTFAQAATTLRSPAPSRSVDSLSTLLGGVHAGYGRRLGAHAFLGVEGDIAFPYFADDGVILSRPVPQGGVMQKLDFLSTLRGRFGYARGPWLLYGTSGLAWAQMRFGETATQSGAASTQLPWSIGWTAGAGAELAIAPRWSVSAEYRFDRLGAAAGISPAGVGDQVSGTSANSLQLGLSWHFDPTFEPAPATMAGAWLLDPSSYSIHGQATVVEQGYFGFRSPYEGANSLSGSRQSADTVSLTAFLGLHLWRGGALYFNPEINQGFGLSQTYGIAAFPNGEAQKASYAVPRLNIDRAMVRQTFGLGGESSVLEDGPNQLPETRDVSRITVTVGRLSTGDVFDLNTYATDPRTQFLNWNIYGGGSYDWTMDRPGFTWGAIVELNQARWAFRVGYFLEPAVSNGITFDTNIPTRGQYLAEPEVRYSLFSQPGVARLMLWVNRANMGSYSAALAMPGSTPGYPDITQTRTIRADYGLVLNVEQALSRDLGLFSRASWTPGLLEVMGWTDCDESLSLGAQLMGRSWRRPEDHVGLAGLIEGLSPEARAYFAAGGLGILIGDGHLNYRPEEVLEAYYALGVTRWATVSLDYQFVANPAYNADRGPVSIYAARLHAEL
jgi:high affinity Mn2+ porin